MVEFNAGLSKMASPQYGEQESNRLRGAQLSLRALFAVTFVTACLARFPGRYGIGVLVIVGWFVLAGVIVGLVVATAVAIVDLVIGAASRSRPNWSLAWIRFGRCVMAGTLAGLIMQGLAVACCFSLINPPPTNILNSWTEGTKALSPVFREPLAMQFLMVSPALLSALSISTARAFANRKATTGQSIAPTGCLFATLFGLTPLVLVIIWLFFIPKPPSRPGHENMLGLLPIAVPLWCAMAAAIGDASGVAAATLLTLVSHAQHNRHYHKVLWCAAIVVAILVTETAIHGWTGKALEWWTK